MWFRNSRAVGFPSPPELWFEPKIEHLVCLINNQRSDPVQLHHAWAGEDVVEQPTRSRNNQVNAPPHSPDLSIHHIQEDSIKALVVIWMD